MKILIQGGGGREYALAENFVRHGHSITAAPGNAAFERYLDARRIPYEGPEQLTAHAVNGGYDLVVAGPEAPLKNGLGDLMHEAGVPFFGSRKAHARLEWSKAYLQDLLKGRNFITPGRSFRSRQAALEYLKSEWAAGREHVVKADGLHGGKGVWVPANLEEAVHALDNVMRPPPYGWGEDVVLQRTLRGQQPDGGELSTMTIVGNGDYPLDARTINLPSSRDNKPVGPNAVGLDIRSQTGGMGGDSPNPFIDDAAFNALLHSHTIPLIEAVEEDAGIGPDTGVMYNGLMMRTEPLEAALEQLYLTITLLESNKRVGDPEAQYVLSRMRDTDLAQMLRAAATGEDLSAYALVIDPRPSATLVFATRGYPDSAMVRKNKGLPLRGLGIIDNDPDMVAYFAGVEWDGRMVSAGGRVFTVSRLAATREEAWDGLYGIVDHGRAVGLGDGPEDVHFRPDLKNPVV